LSSIHKEGNRVSFICQKYNCTTFTSRVNVVNKNTVRTDGIQITLYLIMYSVSVVKKLLFFYENMV